MKKPVFSIITSNYNGAEFLGEAIESVLSQAGDFFIDYQIIDAASTDNSLEVIKQYQQELSDNCDLKNLGEVSYYVGRSKDYKFGRCLGISFRYISEPDDGLYFGVNKGISTAWGDIIAYLNSDDIYLPYAFQNVADSFVQDSELGVVYGESLRINKQGEVTGRYPVKDVYKHDLTVENLIDQPACFINASAVANHGKFNTEIANSADYEMWLRLLNAGEKFQMLTAALAATRLYADTKTASNRSQIHIETFAIAKHYSGKLQAKGREEFTMGLSLFGRLSWLVVRAVKWIRLKKLRVFTYLYLVFNKSKIQKTEIKYFRSRSPQDAKQN